MPKKTASIWLVRSTVFCACVTVEINASEVIMAILFERWLIVGIAIICLIICGHISTIQAQRTFLDNFINEYRKFRIGLFKFVGRSDTDAAYLWSLKRQVFDDESTSKC